jgi:hypothetical protein
MEGVDGANILLGTELKTQPVAIQNGRLQLVLPARVIFGDC